MLKCTLTILTPLVFFYCSGQSKVVYQAENKTLILDVENRQYITIDTTLWNNEKLVWVDVQNDSLICLYTLNGLSFRKCYALNKIEPIAKKAKKAFKPRVKPNSYYFHNFYFKDYRLTVFSNNGISLLQGDQLLWNASADYKFNKNLDENNQPSIQTGFKFPILSPDGKNFLIMGYRNVFFNSSAKLYEVDMANGRMRLVGKNLYNPSYSANGQYILFSNYPHGQYFIIDRTSKKRLFDHGLENAFWITRLTNEVN